MNKENLPSGSGTLSPASASPPHVTRRQITMIRMNVQCVLGSMRMILLMMSFKQNGYAAQIVDNGCMKTVSLLNKKLMCGFSVTVSSNNI